jgi:hypothetical protein
MSSVPDNVAVAVAGCRLIATAGAATCADSLPSWSMPDTLYVPATVFGVRSVSVVMSELAVSPTRVPSGRRTRHL